MNTTKREKKAKEDLLGKCWGYFNDNFHKFSNNNKIKIGLALCVKDMPTSPLIDQSIHQHYVIFRNPEAIKENASGIRPRTEVKDAQLSPR